MRGVGWLEGWVGEGDYINFSNIIFLRWTKWMCIPFHLSLDQFPKFMVFSSSSGRNRCYCWLLFVTCQGRFSCFFLSCALLKGRSFVARITNTNIGQPSAFSYRSPSLRTAVAYGLTTWPAMVTLSIAHIQCRIKGIHRQAWTTILRRCRRWSGFFTVWC